MHVAGSGPETRLGFPNYEEGSRLGELTVLIAGAPGTNACQPEGSPLELLVRFAGYPNEFALWWDGVTCELGCSVPGGIEMDRIAAKLASAGMFVAA